VFNEYTVKMERIRKYYVEPRGEILTSPFPSPQMERVYCEDGSGKSDPEKN
jgi:hypothetical protein